MSGGVAYVYDDDGQFAKKCNHEMVELEKPTEAADKETILFKPSDQLILDTRTGATPPPRQKGTHLSDDILFKG